MKSGPPTRRTKNRSPYRRRFYSASELAYLLQIPLRNFFAARPLPCGRESRLHGRIPVFNPAKLPFPFREKLEGLAVAAPEGLLWRLLPFGQTDETAASARKATQPILMLSRAYSYRRALFVYFCALDNGEDEQIAALKAQHTWVWEMGRPTSTKTIRRRAACVRQFGGPEHAPLDAYFDNKTAPHPGARKRKDSAA